MRGEHEHLGNLHMLRSRRRIEHYVSNVVTREWFDSVIDVVRPLLVAMENLE